MLAQSESGTEAMMGDESAQIDYKPALKTARPYLALWLS